eukprot:6490782-Amphidinium_carterae.3
MMSVPKKTATETPDEKAMRLMLSGARTGTSSLHKRCVKAMLENPAVLPQVERLLKGLGLLNGGASGQSAEQSENPAKVARTSSASSLEGDGTVISASVSGGDVECSTEASSTLGGDKQLGKNYATLQGCSVKLLEVILSTCEDISLSRNNLRGLIKPPARVPDKETCLEILEFITGHAVNVSIPPEYRSEQKLPLYMRSLSEQLGNRGQALRLPPSWAQEGVYLVSNREDAYVLEHKFSGKQAVIPPEWVADPPDAEQLMVDDNYSELNAKLLWLPSKRLAGPSKCIFLIPPVAAPLVQVGKKKKPFQKIDLAGLPTGQSVVVTGAAHQHQQQQQQQQQQEGESNGTVAEKKADDDNAQTTSSEKTNMSTLGGKGDAGADAKALAIVKLSSQRLMLDGGRAAS